MFFLPQMIGPVFILLCFKIGFFLSVYLYTLFLAPAFFLRIIIFILLNKKISQKNYIQANIVSGALLGITFYFIPISSVFSNNYLFVLSLISFIQFIFLAQDITYYNPSLYAYLSSRLSFSYIHSQIVRLICITLGVIFAFMTFLLFQELNTVLWLLLIGVMGILPFIIACLIKAQFKLSVISEAFNMPSLNVSEVSSFKRLPGQSCIWLNKEELQETALQLKSKKWYEQEKYYPAFLIVFYLSFIFMFDSGDILPWQTPLLRTLSIIVLVLTIIVLFGKKLSFIVAPITFLLILGGVFLTGGTFGVLELVFLTLVTGSSVTNWRLPKL